MAEAKRKLSEFDFSKKGCHISLVGPSAGGPANGVTTLVLKSLSPQGVNTNPNGEGNKMTVEMIEKSVHDTLITKAVADATLVLKSQLDASNAELDALKAEKVSAAEAVRKSKIAAVLGDAKVDETFMAIKSLDDTNFDIVLKSFASVKESEAKTAAFTEKGVAGKTDTDKMITDAEDNGTMAILKAKYQQTK